MVSVMVNLLYVNITNNGNNNYEHDTSLVAGFW